MQKIKSKTEKRLIIEGQVNGKSAFFSVNSERWFDLSDFENEEWREIPNYEERYMVSNYGRVKRLPYIQHECSRNRIDMPMPMMIMRISTARYGYAKVTLCLNGKMKTPQVHRLVAEAFIPNPENKPQVNHKDECKWNNSIGNLEWCTSSYNIHYGTKLKRQGETFKANGKRSHPVIQYSRDGAIINKYRSIREAAIDIMPNKNRGGRASFNISQCCKGITKSAYNYIWKYENEKN